MVRIVNLEYNKKQYTVLNNWKPLAETEFFTNDVQDMSFIYEQKKRIAHYNRSKAQKERWQKQKEAKALGIPYVPETKRRTETYIEPQKEISKKEINPNVGLFRNIKK